MPSNKPEARPAEVMIVEDHPIIRNGLRALIENQGHKVCCECDTGVAALQYLRSHSPNLMILDLSLRDTNGLDLIREALIFRKTLPILICTVQDETTYAQRAIRAGARGFIMKDATPEQLQRAVNVVLEGDVYVSEGVAGHLLDRMSPDKSLGGNPLAQLTDRELEVFELTGQGLSVRSIADRLCLSAKTIESYRDNIRNKLGIRGSNELMRLAIQWVVEGRMTIDDDSDQ